MSTTRRLAYSCLAEISEDQAALAAVRSLDGDTTAESCFCLNGNIVVAAEVNGAGASFQVGAVRQLFEVRRRTESYLGMGSNVYGVTADGQRFLVNVVDEEQAALRPPITVITNWTSTLR